MRCLVKHSPGLLGVASIIIPVSERRNLKSWRRESFAPWCTVGTPTQVWLPCSSLLYCHFSRSPLHCSGTQCLDQEPQSPKEEPKLSLKQVSGVFATEPQVPSLSLCNSFTLGLNVSFTATHNNGPHGFLRVRREESWMRKMSFRLRAL